MKNSSKKNLQFGAAIGGVIGLISNSSKQLKYQKKNPQLKFDFQSLILAGILGTILGAVNASLINLFLSVFNSRKEILGEADEIKYLVSAIDSYQTDETDKEVLITGQKIKNELKFRFRNDILGKVSNQGSVKQGTALSGLSDLDIRIQFKKTSFKNEYNMYNTVYYFLKDNFKDINLVEVRKQKVSLGLIFDIDGEIETIDIVPVLRTDFIRGKNDYNLYKNPDLCIGSRKLKMNPKKQEEFGDYQNDKIDIIKLIKLLKTELELPLKSILIKELTIKAFETNVIPLGLNGKLLMTLNFIKDNIDTISIKAPDNPMISLTDNLTEGQKKKIKSILNIVIMDIEKDKNALHDYFPEKV
ncbi:hypothetical protein [Formosa sp. S-31]|uniref:hypothetical protein n=1 Tax=Formosa sp. S-31 TaxID=2790949 RepID=UPI003EBD4BD4